MIKLLSVVILAAMLVSGAAGQAPATIDVRDDVLILFPFRDAAKAERATVAGVRVYRRLPEAVLAGATLDDLRRFDHAGLRYDIVDRDPWSREYALVGAFRHARIQESYPGCDLFVLRSWTDHQLVKGGSAGFQTLRDRGYSVVQLEKRHGVALAPEAHLILPQTIQADSAIAAIIALVSDTSIGNYIQELQNFGTRYWGNANRDTVARWVKARYIEAGLVDAELDSFQFSSTWQKNVVASIPGGGEQEAEMIVGGHHDSYSSNQLQAPGADDNATGAVAALEMARVLKLVNYAPALTLRFMGFAAEEAGLIGSDRYATAARGAGRNIKVMMNYDMIGNRNQAQTDRDVYVVWYTGAEAFRDLHAAMMRTYTTLTPIATTSYRSGSDSYSFWEQNYPSVFCIERDFSPYYHSPSDLIQYLDLPYARDVVRSGLAMLLTLDQAPPTVAGLRLRDRGDGISLQAEWDSLAVPDLYRYRVYLGTASGVYTSNSQQTTRTKLFTGLTAGTTYYVGVSMVDLAGREGMIAEVSMEPRVVPLPPTGLRLEDPGTGVRLAWHPNTETDVVGYHIYQSFQPPIFLRLTSVPLADTVLAAPALDAWYYVTAVDAQQLESGPSPTIFASSTGADEPAPGAPREFALRPNYPNPFNGETRIGYRVQGTGSRTNVLLTVHNVLGQEIATLVQGPQAAGEHTAVFDGTNLPSGVYLAVLQAGADRATMKMLLMK